MLFMAQSDVDVVGIRLSTGKAHQPRRSFSQAYLKEDSERQTTKKERAFREISDKRRERKCCGSGFREWNISEETKATDCFWQTRVCTKRSSKGAQTCRHIPVLLFGQACPTGGKESKEKIQA